MRQKKVIDGHEVYFDSEWIKHLESKDHWVYYWNQADLVNKYTDIDEGIIEIGIGTSFLCNYLRSKNYSITTIDIDVDKKPDYVSSASDFNYLTENAKVVLAFEIFEHIPYDTFNKTIQKISHSNVNNIIFSVPLAQRTIFSSTLKLPKQKEINIRVSLPRFSIKTKNHFWELSYFKEKKLNNGKKLIPETEMKSLFSDYGFHLLRLRKVNNILFFCAKRKL